MPPHPTKLRTSITSFWNGRRGTEVGPIPSNPAVFTAGTTVNTVQDQVLGILRDQFGISPKRNLISYAKPYPKEFDQMPAPPKFKVPEFSKFSGNDNTSTVEHISRYIAQLGIAAAAEYMKVRLFSLSLSGPAFGWYTTLAPGSIVSWKQLEEQFHAHFFTGSSEMSILDLTALRHQQGETV